MTDVQGVRTARDLLREALQAEGHVAGGEAWPGSGCFVLTVQVTATAQIWISDEHAPEVYRSTDRDCIADTANLVRAVTAYVAAAQA